MSAPKHTAGPWFAKSDRRRWNPHFVEAERAHVADVMPCSVVDKKDDAEAEANARLIAAAPDLAFVVKPSVLRRAARTVERDHPGVSVILDALADEQADVLAKATGEAA